MRRKLDLVAKCHPKKESVVETKKQPGISSQHLEAILASEGRQEDVEEEVGMEDNETVSKKSPKESAMSKNVLIQICPAGAKNFTNYVF